MEKEVHVDTYVDVEIEFNDDEVIELLSENSIDLEDVCDGAYTTGDILEYIKTRAEDADFKLEVAKAIGVDITVPENNIDLDARYRDMNKLVHEILVGLQHAEQRAGALLQHTTNTLDELKKDWEAKRAPAQNNGGFHYLSGE